MKHLGDITKLNGHDLPPVNCVIGGSPCQGLSVAGMRKGLQDERSGLFMEQIRIIKEMRERDIEAGRTGADVRPRYMVWENVPGAFTSNKAADFWAVLEETARVKDKDAVIPGPPNGKWECEGAIVADEYSIAWRVYDAQFWGVPQRRKRIALVADFGGQSASEIQFESESLCRNPAKGGEQRKEAAGHTTDFLGERLPVPYGIGSYNSNSWRSPNPDSGVYVADTAKTLDAINCGYPGCNQGGMAVVCLDAMGHDFRSTQFLRGGKVDPLCSCDYKQPPIVVLEGNGSRPSHFGDGYKETDTMYTLNSTEVHGVCYGLDRASYNQGMNAQFDFSVLEDQQPTLAAKGPGAVLYCMSSGQANAEQTDGDKSPTLTCLHEAPIAVVSPTLMRMREGCDGGGKGPLLSEDRSLTLATRNDQVLFQPVIYDMTHPCDVIRDCGDVSPTLQSRMGTCGNQIPLTIKMEDIIVRRLTPLECERLQGYPDGWTDIGDWVDSKGKLHKGDSDAPRYKALGNSIALPCWVHILKGISDRCEGVPLMASLFDGIGGFPLIWESINGPGTAVWASEIEEFPIAVTKKHFPDELVEDWML